MDIRNLAVNTIRVLSVEAVQKAKSGHPGMPMGAAPMAFTLWNDVMNHNPKNPNWFNRDRFILSAGHGSMLLYSLLHLFNYGLTIDDLKNFRQLDSKTPGHPEYGHTVGVEATTGPLGQGLAMGVGMALAESHLAAKYNKPGLNIVDHYTYVIAGDGCMMEGITNEASSFAAANKLSKLIVLYDSNNISIEGSTDISFTENVRARYEALGWDTFYVEDGKSLDDILAAINEAKKTDKPSLIEIKTKIGWDSAKEGSASAHGEPLGDDNIVDFKNKIGWEYEEEFYVPKEVREYISESSKKGELKEEEWNKLLEEYKNNYPEEAKEFLMSLKKDLSDDVFDEEFYKFDKDDASRGYSGTLINRLAEKIPYLIGGSADLSPSNKTEMKNTSYYSPTNREGKNIHFGVRELAMSAISNGISLHGGLLPYCATFLVFSDYVKPTIRLSALMNQQVLYVFTHDSIGVGEDGPTHQPIEQMVMLRSTPNISTFRPADGKETAAAYEYALKKKDGPTVFALTRQKLENLEETGKDALNGGYVLKDLGERIDIILMASGSEVKLICDAAERINKLGYGVRVVSMPSPDVFDKQSEGYKNSVLPKEVSKRVSVEALSTYGWDKYVGLDGIKIGMEGFGASAPANSLFDKFGFTVENIVEKALSILD
ncbi:transketolase [Miniphocaeibacter halophilus]|uniref:Transketolase n=1 Tax=Miniphocaeibacter halophilus TaxID=2931922 RepID=A0AC61MSM8_9FIRM|nr:transketolase [Miniphocaeibacter halophilus]QQK07829.1 transketolase [Miniphocaeibacter halophilus]